MTMSEEVQREGGGEGGRSLAVASHRPSLHWPLSPLLRPLLPFFLSFPLSLFLSFPISLRRFAFVVLRLLASPWAVFPLSFFSPFFRLCVFLDLFL